MIIKKITLENIRSYKYQEIEFPKGSTMLAGDIGSGKTSVLLGIEFALFGLQPGQKGTSLLRNGTKQGRVIIQLEIDGKNILIERSLKRAKTVSQDKAYIETETEKKEMSVTELKNKVLHLLDYPKEFEKKTNLLYKFTVYTPQEEMKQIILENPESRLNTLRHIFGIDKYKRIKENTILFATSLREEIRNKQGQITDLDDIIENKNKKLLSIQNLNQEKNKLYETFLLLSDSRRKIELELKTIKEKLEDKRKYEQELEKTIIFLNSKTDLLKNFNIEQEQLKNQIQEIESIPLDLRLLVDFEKQKTENESLIEDINTKYTEILSNIKSFTSKIDENDIFIKNIFNLESCPTCLQEINPTYKANIKTKFENEISEHKNKVQEHEIKKQDIIKQLDETKKSLQDAVQQINNMNLTKVKHEQLVDKKQRQTLIQNQLNILQKDELLLSSQIETIKKSLEQFSKIQIEHDNKEQEFNLAKNKEKETEVKTAEMTKEIQMTEQQVKELGEQIKNKQEIKLILHNTEELEQWLSDKFLSNISFIERNILITLREEFSKLLNEWFNILVPDIFTIRLDEDFTPVIEQQDFELDYSFLSGGERTAIALAYRLALNQTINSLLSKIKTREIVILDEPTDGFSDQQLDKIRDVLSQLNLKQLIIVSHEQKIESFVEHIIKFKKEAGVTIVEK
ncbi:MAG: AAA family ATPase [Nanoarchaeota archaeon]|nr:AAA family ATPase [Nanoarchaeota archaeon]